MKQPVDYIRFTRKMNLDKAIHSLEGILRGIAIDTVINAAEVIKLKQWLSEHEDVSRQHPFSEIIPILAESLKDGVISEDEKSDLLWVCGNLNSSSIYYDVVTSEIQRLNGMLKGLLADGILTDSEISKMSDWVTENDHLKGCYPFDEIDTLLTSVMADGKIEELEREKLKDFFSAFDVSSNATDVLCDSKKLAISGICAMCPNIIFDSKTFCITGESHKATRDQLEVTIEGIGGRVLSGVRNDLDYLIVCAGGNPCWAFSCYGRKVEKAMMYRKKGSRIVIAHENDLWDAIADRG